MNYLKKHWFQYLGYIAIVVALLLSPNPVSAQTSDLIMAWPDGTYSTEVGQKMGAESFTTPSTGFTLTYLTMRCAKDSAGTGNDTYTMAIYGTTAGSINYSDLKTSMTFSIASLSTNPNKTDKVFNLPDVELAANTEYWFVYWSSSGDHADQDRIYPEYKTTGGKHLIVSGAPNYGDITANTWTSNAYRQKFNIFGYWSGQGPTTYVPADPSGLAVVEGETGTPEGNVAAYVLSWTNNADNDTSWQVQVGNTSNFSDQNWTDTLTTTNLEAWAYPMSTLDWSANYWFRVRAGSAAGYSGWSNTATIETDVPVAPSGLTLTLKRGTNNNYIQVDWTDNSDNETGFIVERSADGNPPADTSWEVDENIDTYDDITGWTLQTTTIYYRVGALSAVGDTMYTGWVSINVSQAVPPQTTNTASGIIGTMPWAEETWFPYAAMFVLMLAAFGFSLYLSRDRKLGVIFGGVGAMVVMGIFITLNWINGLIIMALAIAVAVIFLLPKVVGR